MNQKGFTLIELIAVIIIIGAIGAVAAPKFLSLTEAAADRAAGQAVSEGKARLTNQYAIHLMNSDADPYNLAGIICEKVDRCLQFFGIKVLDQLLFRG